LPVFVHSKWLDVVPNFDDIVEILGMTNTSGATLTGERAPASVFFEGLHGKWLLKAHRGENSKHPWLKFRKEVLELLQSDPEFSARSRNSLHARETDDRVMWAYGEIKRILKHRGLYMQASDDSFVLRILHQEFEGGE
jgi:hypothetical protein